MMYTNKTNRIFCLLALCVLFLGQVARAQAPSGEGWQCVTVNDGITYYSFTGVEPVSGSPQRIYVTDWDMSNKDYALRFVWSGERCATSEIFSRENAEVALNAA